jgi:hypothetical protein
LECAQRRVLRDIHNRVWTILREALMRFICVRPIGESAITKGSAAMACNLFIFLRGEHECLGARFEIAYRIVGGSIVCCADGDADPRQTLAVRKLGMSLI